MSPTAQQDKLLLPFLTLATSLFLLLDLVGMLQWFKNFRSYLMFPIHTLSSSIVTNTGLLTTSILQNNSIKMQNLLLKERILELESENSKLQKEIAEFPKFAEYQKTLGLHSYQQTVTAQILDIRVNTIEGTLLLNKGSNDGAKVGMPVIYNNYYVCSLIEVRSADSLCLSFIVPGQEFIGYIPSKKITGIVKIGINGMVLGDLLATEKVSLKDAVSMKKEDFPYFFTLGIISEVPPDDGSAERKAVLDSPLRLSELLYVTIVVK